MYLPALKATVFNSSVPINVRSEATSAHFNLCLSAAMTKPIPAQRQDSDTDNHSETNSQRSTHTCTNSLSRGCSDTQSLSQNIVSCLSVTQPYLLQLSGLTLVSESKNTEMEALRSHTPGSSNYTHALSRCFARGRISLALTLTFSRCTRVMTTYSLSLGHLIA